MKTISEFKLWWTALVVGSILVAATASRVSGLAGVAGGATALLLFSLLLASLPWLVSRFMKRPFTSEQFMWTYTVSWALLAATQFIT